MIHACLTVPLDILQAVFMHRERAVKFWIERNNMDRKSALEMWDSEVLAAKHKDQNGPQDSKLRIPVKLDDFLVVVDAEIYEKEKLLEHKRMKFSKEQGMLMDEGLEAGRAAAPADMARLGVGRECELASLAGGLCFLMQLPSRTTPVVPLRTSLRTSPRQRRLMLVWSALP